MRIAGDDPDPDESIDPVTSPSVAEPSVPASSPPVELRRISRSHVEHVDPSIADELWSIASAVVDDPSVPIAEVAAALPAKLRKRLQRFNAGKARWLLVRGLLPPAVPGRTDVRMKVARAVLEAVLSELGAPATPGQATLAAGYALLDPCHLSQTPWHVADVDHDNAVRADVLGMLCWSPPEPTDIIRFSSVGSADLATIARMVLEQPRFVLPAAELVPPDATDSTTDELQAMAVLSGPHHNLGVCVDARIVRPADPRDRQAEMALRHLFTQLDDLAYGHAPEPGDLLLLDNHRVTHAPPTSQDCVPHCTGPARHLLRMTTTSRPTTRPPRPPRRQRS
jgi:hypothetical protein